MMKNLFSFFLFSLITIGQAEACPMCMGDNPNDKYFLYIVGVFILLIYIPMFYLFKTFIKLKDVNQSKSDSDLSS